MAQRAALLLLCLAPLWASGCAWFGQTARPTLVQRLRPPMSSADTNIIALDVAIIERPLGDPVINRELWESADTMVVGLDQRNALSANGYRFGQVVGLTPEALQVLLRSERYCLNPRRRLVASGNRVTQVLGPVYTQAMVTVRENDQRTSLTLDQARFCLDVTPTLTPERKIRLQFTPKVETGEQMLPFQPDVDRSTWTLRVDKPCRTFNGLSWDVTVEPNRFLVLGALTDDRDTLGYHSLTQQDPPKVQRLLVLRVCPASGSSDGIDASLNELLQGATNAPLALQAARAPAP